MTNENIDVSWGLDISRAARADVRARVVAYIANETQYDAESVNIDKYGAVSAILDANKTFAGPHEDRLLVGYVSEILRAA